MSAQKHFIFWLSAFAAFLGFIYVFKSVLLPFVLGGTVAYLLNPAVHKFKSWGISRKHAALFILFIFFSILAVVLAVLSPVLYREMLEFTDNLPAHFNAVISFAEPLINRVENFTGQDMSSDFKNMLRNNSDSAVGVAKQVLQGLAQGGQAFLGFLSLIVIMPIVAYFVMKEWDHITAWIKDLMPRDNKNTIMGLLKDIDTKLAGFIRGQITVAFVLAVAYAIALSLAGLKYSVLIGIGSGLLSVIPMVGSTIGLLVSVGVAWFQSGEWTYVLIIAGIFLGGQLIEGNFLTPKLVGDSVGIHPLWIFFALMAGGSLFGILGMLLAVPVAAVVSVLAAFAIKQYKNSPYYKSSSKPNKK